MAKKKSNGTARRKKMKRPARLQAAKQWLPSFNGKNVINGYSKWFGVDRLCAVRELQMLGVQLDPDYVERLKEIAGRNQGLPRLRKNMKLSTISEYRNDQVETFDYIAGYTSWGFPFGLTWEQMERIEKADQEAGESFEEAFFGDREEMAYAEQNWPLEPPPLEPAVMPPEDEIPSVETGWMFARVISNRPRFRFCAECLEFSKKSVAFHIRYDSDQGTGRYLCDACAASVPSDELDEVVY